MSAVIAWNSFKFNLENKDRALHVLFDTMTEAWGENAGDGESADPEPEDETTAADEEPEPVAEPSESAPSASARGSAPSGSAAVEALDVDAQLAALNWQMEILQILNCTNCME